MQRVYLLHHYFYSTLNIKYFLKWRFCENIRTWTFSQFPKDFLFFMDKVYLDKYHLDVKIIFFAWNVDTIFHSNFCAQNPIHFRLFKISLIGVETLKFEPLVPFNCLNRMDFNGDGFFGFTRFELVQPPY